MTTSHHQKIGFGGGCHWCTEAVFQSLSGVTKVEQGWLASFDEHDSLSEGVIVHFDSQKLPLEALITIHLATHSSTSNHSMRSKYRSTIYYFSEHQAQQAENCITKVQADINKMIITQVLAFNRFKENSEKYRNYYYSNPDKPFCQTVIQPKLDKLMSHYGVYTNKKKLNSQ
ncbi:peptide-methionine (S)-S-oxide reductase [Pleionea sp. CnH1-48]|nr:peptide-methionine (S)-S-oxide reductase [Pleionea sp. CnH1-48]